MRLLAIDPGPVESALVAYDPDAPVRFLKAPNDEVATQLRHGGVDLDGRWDGSLYVEMIASYGMPVGAEVFETCVWIGRFMQVWRSRAGVLPGLIYRRDVKLHLCGSARAKDPNVRQALIDRYGGKETAIGRKATPGPLYGLSGDCWAALGVAVTAAGALVAKEAA